MKIKLLLLGLLFCAGLAYAQTDKEAKSKKATEDRPNDRIAVKADNFLFRLTDRIGLLGVSAECVVRPCSHVVGL